MKKYLTEAIEENTRILVDFEKIITDWVYANEKLSVKRDYLSDILGFGSLQKKYADNPLYENNKQNLTNLTVDVFFNPVLGRNDEDYAQIIEVYGNISVYGYFKKEENRIALFFHDIEKNANNDQHIKRLLKSTITHELRHFFQYNEYPDYYTANMYMTVYNKQPVEVDAVFYQVLSEIDPYVHINQPDVYVKTVIDLLDRERPLTDKQKNHYKKKAAAYFTKHIGKNIDDVWKKAIIKNKKYLDLKYPMETFVGNTMDELENYTEKSHFRKMNDKTYMIYRKKTMDHYKEQTQNKRETQQVNKLYSQLYPSFMKVLNQKAPQITNSRISPSQVLNDVLVNIKQIASSRGINTNTVLYKNVEQQFAKKLDVSLAQYRS